MLNLVAFLFSFSGAAVGGVQVYGFALLLVGGLFLELRNTPFRFSVLCDRNIIVYQGVASCRETPFPAEKKLSPGLFLGEKKTTDTRQCLGYGWATLIRERR